MPNPRCTWTIGPIHRNYAAEVSACPRSWPLVTWSRLDDRLFSAIIFISVRKLGPETPLSWAAITHFRVKH